MLLRYFMILIRIEIEKIQEKAVVAEMKTNKIC